MQQHLDHGCGVCANHFQSWQRLANFAGREANQQPPEFAIRQARGNFSLLKMASNVPKSVELASLVFDSSTGAIANIRGRSASGRQLLYKSGTMCIDLQLLPKRGTASLVLVGQLLDLLTPKGDIPVSLMRHGSSVSCKRTNQFGEFDFGFDAPEDMHLAFNLEGGTTLIIPVPDAPLNPQYATAH
jgi:hypothetical protein